MPPKMLEHEDVLPIAAPAMTHSKILLAGRDPLTTGLLAKALAGDLTCDAVAIRAADLLEVLKTSNADLVIINSELNSEPGGGFELASAISRTHPSLPIVLLLDNTSRDLVIRAFRSGASGVCNLQEPMSEFVQCIKHVKEGGIWAKNGAKSCLLDAIKNIPSPAPIQCGDAPVLTARELQVVQCAAMGKTNKIIAQELHLSEHTVKNYLFRAFEKLGVSSRVELLFYLTVQGHNFNRPSIEPDRPIKEEAL